MKALRFILLSYMQQNFMSMFVLLVGILYFLAALVTTLTGEYSPPGNGFKPWTNHYFALIFILFSVVVHFKNVIQSSASALLPNYRQYQLIALGMILAVLIFLPLLINGLRGFRILAPLAMLLITASLMLWGLFYFTNSIIAYAIIIWIGKIVHELLGYTLPVMVLRNVPDLTFLKIDFIPILVIATSVVLLVLFVRFVLKMTNIQFWESPKGRTNPYTKDYDIMTGFTENLIKRKLISLLKPMTEPDKRSAVYISRLLQPALFSPGYSSVVNGLINAMGFLCYIGTIAFVFYSGIDMAKFESKFSVSSFLLIIYFIGAGMLSQDFLQHRHRMADLWLRVQLPTRKDFTRATILTYLFVAVRQFVISTIAIFVLLLLLQTPPIKIILIIAAGFVAFTAITALAMQHSHRIESADCRGWMVASIIVGVSVSGIFALIMRGFSYNSSSIWWFLLAAETVCVCLFWLGTKRWSSMEFNFIGPQEDSLGG